MKSNERRVGHPLIGEVYMVTFEAPGSVQNGHRPAIVFQNNVGNRYSPNVVVLPVTGVKKKVHQPTHVLITAEKSGMNYDSMVLCENPQCIPKERLEIYVTTLPEECMGEIAEASLLANGAIAYLDPDAIQRVRERAARLNAV